MKSPTNSHEHDYQVAAAYELIQRLDLSAIRRKLLDCDHGAGWSEEVADRAEVLYRYFLTLQAVYSSSELPVVPPRLADEFWHQHILDTRKYEADCVALFGRFLHHYPYFGMRGPEDERALQRAGEWTHRLMQYHFGESAAVDAASCAGKCSSCSSRN